MPRPDPAGTPRHDAEYVLPLKWATRSPQDPAVAELASYLAGLRELVHVTVVDGSPEPAFAIHHEAWADLVRHVPPSAHSGRNGKVAGVVTGVTAARHERVVIADDDVRHDEGSLSALLAALDGVERPDLVRPQNYFDPLPWHTRWDTGRILLNRALGHDHAGTWGLRRSIFLSMGGYDGDVLFENLELARTIRAAGGTLLDLPGLYVRRLPPSTTHFWTQRVRQAYDDLAQPVRLVGELSLLPLATVAVLAAGPAWLLLGLVLAAAVAEAGRRRAGGRFVFSPDAALWAVPWLAERAVCVWLALGHRALGGVPYRGTRVPRAATSLATLRRRQSLLRTGTFDSGRGGGRRGRLAA